eukprot:1577250-Rhodomonas_salina.2
MADCDTTSEQSSPRKLMSISVSCHADFRISFRTAPRSSLLATPAKATTFSSQQKLPRTLERHQSAQKISVLIGGCKIWERLNSVRTRRRRRKVPRERSAQHLKGSVKWFPSSWAPRRCVSVAQREHSQTAAACLEIRESGALPCARHTRGQYGRSPSVRAKRKKGHVTKCLGELTSSTITQSVPAQIE